MEDKRIVLAIILSLVVFLGWHSFAEYMGWISPKVQHVANELHSSMEQVATSNIALDSVQPVFSPSTGKDVYIETPLYIAKIHSSGGILSSFILKKYKVNLDSTSPLVNLVSPEASQAMPLGITLNGQPSWSNGNWSFLGEDLYLKAGEAKELTFVGIVNGIKIIRTLTFNADSYLIHEKLQLASEKQNSCPTKVGLLVAATPFGTGQYDPTRMAWSIKDSFKEETSIDTLKEKGFQESGEFNWGGVMSNYFMNVVALSDPLYLTIKGRIQNDVWRVALERSNVLIPAEGTTSITVNWWFGPKDRELLSNAPDKLENAIDFGMFSIIAKPLLTALTFFYEYTGNWGVAIIVLTLCIKIAFWPLSQKSYNSMEQMKKLQPMMQKLREKYANDRDTLNREIMQLYRTYKVNPAGGCLPILLQIPVFIGLYQALLNSIELRHATFIYYLPFTHLVWLADLSAADPFYITPLLMGASMFLQQKLTPASGDPTQQKIMMVMPIIFTVMFLNFPAGLVIYWLFNNLLSIGQQWWMLRKA